MCNEKWKNSCQVKYGVFRALYWVNKCYTHIFIMFSLCRRLVINAKEPASSMRCNCIKDSSANVYVEQIKSVHSSLKSLLNASFKGFLYCMYRTSTVKLLHSVWHVNCDYSSWGNSCESFSIDSVKTFIAAKKIYKLA